ncbi:MAG: cell division protein ZapA [Proteobacteria bacterium]|nr:cell division protein ZapA [Pseudomonadota bacterium]
MSEVTVDVAGRSYRLGCGADEEEHLTGLAAMLDGEARGLLRQFGQMSEGRLLLMTALMIADRLAEAEDKTYQTEQRLAQAETLAESRAEPSDMFSPEREEELTSRINALVAQIESLGGDGEANPAD